MVGLNVKWSQLSLETFISNLQTKVIDIENTAGVTLTEFANQVMTESKAEVPIDTTTLQQSGYVEQPRRANGKVWVKIGYGGMNDKRNPDTGQMASEYALKVHETKGTSKGGGNYHPYGKWKFLEDPLRRNKKVFYQIIGIKLRALLNKGGAVKHV